MQSLKKMWKDEVCVSQEMYADFKLIMWFTRLVGMFPLVVKKTRQGLFLKLSSWLFAYSYTFGLLIIGMGYYGEVLDIISKGKNSIKVGSNTDVIVVLLAFSGFCIVTFCGIFIMPMKTSQFFDYIRCINQVDSIIHTTYKKSDRYKSMIMLAVLISTKIFGTIKDVYMAYLDVGDKIGLLEILKRNGGVYLVGSLIIVVSFMNRHMAYSLEKRLLRLNELLKSFKTTKSYIMKKVIRRSDFSCKDVTIVQLSKAYSKLMDAVRILNDLLGLTALIIFISVMFLLTVSSYFLILLLEGKRQGFIAVLPRIITMIMRIVQVLLITEPWYACFMQVEVLKGHVCRLSSGNVDGRLRKQIHSFAMVICLRPFGVSACGFFSVDRTLFTSLIESVTTYVVILLQAESNGGP